MGRNVFRHVAEQQCRHVKHQSHVAGACHDLLLPRCVTLSDCPCLCVSMCLSVSERARVRDPQTKMLIKPFCTQGSVCSAFNVFTNGEYFVQFFLVLLGKLAS